MHTVIIAKDIGKIAAENYAIDFTFEYSLPFGLEFSGSSYPNKQ
jgi:hypothetical protein